MKRESDDALALIDDAFALIKDKKREEPSMPTDRHHRRTSS
jgi:hypothetical protein